jgi:hypothetical protein
LVKLGAMESQQSTWRVKDEKAMHDEGQLVPCPKRKRGSRTSRVHWPHRDALGLIALSILYGGHYERQGQSSSLSRNGRERYFASPRSWPG